MHGFQTLNFKISTSDGHNCILLEDVDYIANDGTKYRLPANSAMDGASTPRELWVTIPPFGAYWKATCMHDCAYRNTLLVETNGTFVKANLPKDKCESLLKEAMLNLGVNRLEAEVIYMGVVIGGKHSFNEDRAADIIKK